MRVQDTPPAGGGTPTRSVPACGFGFRAITQNRPYGNGNEYRMRECDRKPNRARVSDRLPEFVERKQKSCVSLRRHDTILLWRTWRNMSSTGASKRIEHGKPRRVFSPPRSTIFVFSSATSRSKVFSRGWWSRQRRKNPPYSHDLPYLAGKAGLRLDEQDIHDLKVISTFNIAARYDNDKFTFYKKCTPEYTAAYFEKSKKIFVWLTEQYREK